MRKSLALLGVSLAILAIGCSGGGGDEKPAEPTGKVGDGNMNSMKKPDDPNAPIPGKNDFTTIKATLENFCYPCHNAQNKTDDVNIEGLASAEDLKKVSSNIIEVLESKKMPPANAPKHPTDAERAALVESLKSL